MNKTLGQIAFEAWARKRGEVDDWIDLNQVRKMAWESVAIADALEKGPPK